MTLFDRSKILRHRTPLALLAPAVIARVALLGPVFLGLGLVSPAVIQAALFTESFETDATGSGTTPAGFAVSNNTRVFVVDSNASDGTQSLFFRNGSNRIATMTPAVSLDTASSIEIGFDLAQGSNSFEAGDRFELRIDFGTGDGFQVLLSDAGLIDGFDGSYAGVTNTLGSGAGFSTAFVPYSVSVSASAIPAAASDFRLQFFTNSGSNDEDYFVDNISVTDISAIPEPASLALVGLGAACLMSRSRRAAG